MSNKKDGDSVATVLNYLVKQNRPYSAVDIFNNLHKDVGKTAVQKALDLLVVSGKVIEKVYGKQKVYVIDQKCLPSVDETEVKRLDDMIGELSEKVSNAQKNLKENEVQLAMLKVSLTTSDAEQRVVKLSEETERLRMRLGELKKNPHQITVEDNDKIKGEREKYVKEWRKRKRLTSEIVDAVLEGYPKDKKALYEEAGVETDESVGIEMPRV